MPPLADHPLRYALANELHARPAPQVSVPATVVLLATKPVQDAAARDRGADRAHLHALLDRHGAAHPAPEATHHDCVIGKHGLKWENHTEFTTYTAIGPRLPTRPFDPAAFSVFPAEWLDAAPGARVTSIVISVDAMPMKDAETPDLNAISADLAESFVGESLAASDVLDGVAVVASDFRIDPAGHVRMAVYVRPGTGPRRVGRIVQRLCEIETYKSMSMLGLARARQVSTELGRLDREMTALVGEMAQSMPGAERSLDALMSASAQLEQMEMDSAFRFGATRAYEQLVQGRIAALREARMNGHQTFDEFMQRRFDPAMRTVKAAEGRLASLSARATRAGRLLSTKVEVARSAQNQALLKSMDRRADLQLRLQHTVEGLSVVAISYYAVGLAANLVMPVAAPLGLSSAMVMALLTPLVVLGVWGFVRRLRRRLAGSEDREL
jgi:uncharacterized membrane-anchored protein